MNTTFIDGGAAVSADNLNSFTQTVNTMSDLRAFVGVTGMTAIVLGQNTVNDGDGGQFYWNASGTHADDNGVTTVVPTGSGSGVWSRLNFTGIGSGGTWTPVLTGSVVQGSPNYSAQNGKFTQVGNIVFATFSITLTALGGISGLIDIAGLPIANNSFTGSSGGGLVAEYSGVSLSAGAPVFSCLVLPGSTSIILLMCGTNTTNNVHDTNLTATSQLSGFVTYMSS